MPTTSPGMPVSTGHVIPNLHPTLFSTFSTFNGSSKTLGDLVQHFSQREHYEDDDICAELQHLQMTPTGLLEVPRRGSLALTDWSRRQLANFVGIRWDKWFQQTTPAEQAEEINRRFARTSIELKLRTTQLVEPGVEADGTLQAFVSPGYTAVRDSVVAQAMQTSLSSVVDNDLRIIRADLTSMTTSYVIGIGKPYQVGGAGEVGDVWGGILVRNSGVGYASLSIVLHLTRLVCRNGLTAPLQNAELLRHRHTKGIASDRIFQMLGERLIEVPGKLRHCGQILLQANATPIDNPADIIGTILDNNGLPRRYLPPILSAYEIEPRRNAFGVTSAITRAAQQFSPEERLELEQAASRYLTQ